MENLTQKLAKIEIEYFKYVEKESQKEAQKHKITDDKQLNEIRIKIMQEYSIKKWKNEYNKNNQHIHDINMREETLIVKYRLLESKIAKDECQAEFQKRKNKWLYGSWHFLYKLRCFYSYVERHTQYEKERLDITDERILDYIRLNKMRFFTLLDYINEEYKIDLSNNLDNDSLYNIPLLATDSQQILNVLDDDSPYNMFERERNEFLVEFDYENHEDFIYKINDDYKDFEYPKKPTDTLNEKKYELFRSEVAAYAGNYKKEYIRDMKEIEPEDLKNISFEKLDIDKGLKVWLNEINKEWLKKNG